jgi:hypothetical protein
MLFPRCQHENFWELEAILFLLCQRERLRETPEQFFGVLTYEKRHVAFVRLLCLLLHDGLMIY